MRNLEGGELRLWGGQMKYYEYMYLGMGWNSYIIYLQEIFFTPDEISREIPCTHWILLFFYNQCEDGRGCTRMHETYITDFQKLQPYPFFSKIRYYPDIFISNNIHIFTLNEFIWLKYNIEYNKNHIYKIYK